MKKGVVFIIFVFCALPVQADTYQGLAVGEATKSMVDRKFGNPIREVIPGIRYDYPSQEHDAKRLSVTFDKETGVLESINIYVNGAYTKQQFMEWLQLNEPMRSRYSEEGTLIEEYINDGIALHYNGADDSGPIKYIRYFSTNAAPRFGARQNFTTRGEGQEKPADDNGFAFLGVQISEHGGQGIKVLSTIHDSPAQQAGLRNGDVILEAGDYPFYQESIRPREFAEAVKSLPVETPIKFIVARGGQQFEVGITLRSMTQEQKEALDKQNKEEAHQSYKNGRKAYSRKDYKKAIKYYQEAVSYDPGETKYIKALGQVYFKLGDMVDAVKVYQQALEVRPCPEIYLMLGEIYHEAKRYDGAIIYLEKAERLLDKPKENVRLQELLAMCYFQKGQFDEAVGYALNAYRKSRKRSVLASFYLAACFDRQGNARDAMYYYKRFIKLKPKDARREVFARTRLKELKNSPQYRQQRQKMRKGIVGMFGKIVDGIKDVNSNAGGTDTTVPSSPNDSSWDQFFDNGGDDMQKYDDVFTMPSH